MIAIENTYYTEIIVFVLIQNTKILVGCKINRKKLGNYFYTI